MTTKLQERHEEKIEAIPESESIETLTCKFCGSEHIIKYGKANEKQVYECKSCARKFAPNQGFEGMWHDPPISIYS